MTSCRKNVVDTWRSSNEWKKWSRTWSARLMNATVRQDLLFVKWGILFLVACSQGHRLGQVQRKLYLLKILSIVLQCLQLFSSFKLSFKSTAEDRQQSIFAVFYHRRIRLISWKENLDITAIYILQTEILFAPLHVSFGVKRFVGFCLYLS